MAVYALYACESTYGGMHGMNEYCFVEEDNFTSAEMLAEEMSYQVIEDYALEQEYFDEEYSEEDLAEYLLFSCVEMSSECPYSLKELNNKAYDCFDDLVEKYGVDQ